MIPAALGGLGTEALGFESALGIAVGSSGMPREAARVLIAYDGSEVSRAAVRHASELFAGRPAVLATVWEEGLAATPIAPDAMRMGTLPQDPRTIETFDRDRERASTVASDGAQLARSVGLVAEAQAVPDEVDVADTLIDIARERGAAVIVVGSHGISGLPTRLLGSVSRKLIQHCDRPVLVIRDDSA
jgi:nucleotide-binding universal stress UspA family protein